MENINFKNDKNAELKEILAKRKVEREKNQKPKQENISIIKAEKFRAKQEQFKKEIENKKQNDPNFRDYDEDPLIIQSYEKYIVSILFFSNLLITGSICVILRNIYINGFNSHEYILGILSALCLVIGMFIYDSLYRVGHKIKFTNQYIEFIDNGKLKRKCDVMPNELIKPFGQSCMKANHFIIILVKFIAVVFMLIAVVKTYGLALVAILIYYISNIIVKFVIYILINGNLNGFKIFPFIQIAEPHSDGYRYGAAAILHERYYMIYLFNNEIYEEVKKYFLQQGINIDNLPKKYSIF